LEENPVLAMRDPGHLGSFVGALVPSRAPAGRALALLAALALAAPAALAGETAPQPGPSRVLVLQSYGTDFAPFNRIASAFRTELARRRPEPVEFHEVSLESARFGSERVEEPFVDYLHALFAGRRIDLVVPVGGPAVRFAGRHRARLFPDVPMLHVAFEERLLDDGALEANDAAVPVRIDFAARVEELLRLLPETEELAIVLGTSPVERVWRQELGMDLARFESRLRLEWLDGLALDQMRSLVAALPRRSAVLFMLLIVDGAGVPYPQDEALRRVRAASSVPVFGVLESQLGQGIVGGRLISITEMVERSVEAASRLLDGESAATLRYPPLLAGRPVFDGRELGRWGIAESRLPPDSEIRFEATSPWSRYRWPILAVVLLITAQSALIAALFLHRARRRAAEQEVRALHGRLLTSYEQERGRLARELHDDVTQRLARLTLDAAQIDRRGAGAGAGELTHRMREELARLTDDVHDLSRRLHPSVLFDLGLAEALRSEAERFAAAASMVVNTRLEAESVAISPEVALCLYRFAQESLRNVARHARASHVEISLARREAGVELSVRDDGRGFDVEAAPARGGLGLVSLRERLHLVGGRLTVDSASWRGTTVVAWVPVPEAAS
jgi:signal transduction histidine kinase